MLAGALHRARFAFWIALLRVRLRRHGMRVALHAGAGVRAHAWPHVEVRAEGRGGTLTLELGEGCRLGRDLVLEVATGVDSALRVGRRTTFEAHGRLQLLGGTILLGDDVHVRDEVLLKSRGLLEVGERTVLSKGVIVHATERVSIGARCGIGERSSLIDSDHGHDGRPGHALNAPLKVAPIDVGDNVLVSVNAVVLRGARIGDDSVVAAGAVVLGGEHDGGWLHAGSPARAVRALGD